MFQNQYHLDNQQPLTKPLPCLLDFSWSTIQLNVVWVLLLHTPLNN